jgi:phosphoglycerol transferase MdoB-like AlkP superfamily enzyme
MHYSGDDDMSIIKKHLNTISEKARQVLGDLTPAQFSLMYIAMPFVLDIIIESFNRRSVFKTFIYIWDKPDLFLFNVLIISVTLSFSLVFKRRVFFYVFSSFLWFAFGLTNFIIQTFRVTPFSAIDFTLIKSAIGVSDHYLTPLSMGVIVMGLVIMIIGFIAFFRKAPVARNTNRSRLAYSTLIVFLVFCIAVIYHSSKNVKALSTDFTNIQEAYENYGFAYCFANSIIDTGIDEPDDYSPETVRKISRGLKKKKNSSERPNIIFVQLESFFDLANLKNVKFDKDPIPNFHRLSREYASGNLTVPTVGAGTVNTEFEILTGMRQTDFGTGEYPYKTVLKNNTTESIVNDLKKIGYKSHAVHDNTALFYGRNEVFANMGFDTFQASEYMNGLKNNPNYWNCDDIMPSEIIKTLDSTKGPDFTMAITVQSHGKYKVNIPYKKHVAVTLAPEEMSDQYEYYANQLYEVDQMIGDLINKLSDRNENTVLVLYGDHLPSLELNSCDLKNRSLYETQYVVWSNFGLKFSDRNIKAYQLYPKILDAIGIHAGLINRFQQQHETYDYNYEHDLTNLEYDLLYGDNYAYGDTGLSPFKKTDIQMGTYLPKITSVQNKNGKIFVFGYGFTRSSRILYSGKDYDTRFVNSTELILDDEKALEEIEDDLADRDASDENVFEVGFYTADGALISKTNAVKLK